MAVTQVLEHPDMIGAVIAQIPGDEIERRRHELGWTQKQLAAEARVSERTVQTAERGDVSDRSYMRIVAALEDGERDAQHEARPDLVTMTYTLDSPDGPINVVVTASRQAVGKLDLTAMVRDVLND